ncbi:MAG: hypothetical protein IT323_07890 [Anaerolineae bacterium]|nr:hypothetical protein [Anaerolineae bacterium]
MAIWKASTARPEDVGEHDFFSETEHAAGDVAQRHHRRGAGDARARLFGILSGKSRGNDERRLRRGAGGGRRGFRGHPAT